MNSTLVIVYRSILIGQIVICAWTLVAYGRAFLAVRRADYAVMSLAGLAGIVMLAVGYALSNPYPTSVIHLPVIATVSAYAVRAFSGAPSAYFFEYRSLRAIMLFRQPLPAPPQREGLFVPAAPPQRPSPWAILAMTVVGLCGMVLLMSLFA